MIKKGEMEGLKGDLLNEFGDYFYGQVILAAGKKGNCTTCATEKNCAWGFNTDTATHQKQPQDKQ